MYRCGAQDRSWEGPIGQKGGLPPDFCLIGARLDFLGGGLRVVSTMQPSSHTSPCLSTI
jgi:hypothetical protein